MDESEKKKQDAFYTVLLSAFIESDMNEWDEMANIESRFKSYVDNEYTNYFERLFSFGIPTYQLPIHTSLFRARHIKESDVSKIGAPISEVDDSFLKLFLTDEDLKLMEEFNKNEGNIKFSIKHILLLKFIENNCLSDEQKKKHKILYQTIVFQKHMAFQKKIVEYLL